MAGWSLPCGGDAGCRVKQDPHHSRRQQTQPRDKAGKTETHLNEATNRWSRGEDEGRDGGGGWWELGIDVGEILGRLRSLCAKNRKKRSLNNQCSHSHVPRRGAPIAPTIPPSAFGFCPTYPSLTLPGAPRGQGFEVHGTKIFEPRGAAHFVPFRPALPVLPYTCVRDSARLHECLLQSERDAGVGRRGGCPPSTRPSRVAPPGTWRVVGPTIGARDGGAQLLLNLSMWTGQRLNGLRPPVTPHVLRRPKLAQASCLFGMVDLGSLVIGCLLPASSIVACCCRSSFASPPKLSLSRISTHHHQASRPPTLGPTPHTQHRISNPPVARFRFRRLRILGQDGGGCCPSPPHRQLWSLVVSALSSLRSLRSLLVPRLADFGIVVKARTVDPLRL